MIESCVQTELLGKTKAVNSIHCCCVDLRLFLPNACSFALLFLASDFDVFNSADSIRLASQSGSGCAALRVGHVQSDVRHRSRPERKTDDIAHLREAAQQITQNRLQSPQQSRAEGRSRHQSWRQGVFALCSFSSALQKSSARCLLTRNEPCFVLE